MTPDEMRDALSELGWTQQKFASEVGVTPRAVSLWAQGRRKISGPAVAFLELRLRVREVLSL